jgi:sugar phosphate isomerase/epimerase
MDQVLIATNGKGINSYRDYANANQLGLEIQAFSDPAILAGDWMQLLVAYKQSLSHFSAPIGIHGAFYDMTSASRDPAITELTLMRYRQNLHVADELNAKYVVFHLNYLGLMKLVNYRPEWHRRQVDFWVSFAQEAENIGVTVLLENSWEDDPAIVPSIIEEVGSPKLKACLDFAHASLYSKQLISSWIDAFAPHIFCCHLNNHDGELDLHLPLGVGVIDYLPILAQLRQLTEPPIFCLELPSKTCVDASLDFLDLELTP